MKRRTSIKALTVVVLLGLLGGIVLAQGDTVAIDFWLIGGGGGTAASSGTITLGSTVGQAMAGAGSTTVKRTDREVR